MSSAKSLPNIHVFHTHDHIVVIIQEGAIKGDNVVGMAAMHDLQFSNNALAHLALRFDVNDL